MMTLMAVFRKSFTRIRESGRFLADFYFVLQKRAFHHAKGRWHCRVGGQPRDVHDHSAVVPLVVSTLCIFIFYAKLGRLIVIFSEKLYLTVP